MKVKTAVLRAAGKAEVIDRELPELASHEVLVKVAADNICTSEYGAFNGSRNRPTPLVFGHEWAGTVEAVGSEVSSVAVGDYVASGYYYDPYTLPSREGRTSECPHLMSADHPNDDGFFGNAGCAEYVVSSEVACYKIDDGIDPSVAALLEPLGTCCAGFRRFGCDFGDTVVVIGAGTMGILNALVAKAHGCRVLITEMMPKKLEAARRLGLEAIDVSAVDPVEKVKELTGGKGPEMILDAAGHFTVVQQAVEMVAKGGRIGITGLPAKPSTIPMTPIAMRQISIIGSRAYERKHWRQALNLMANGLDISLVSNFVLPLSDWKKGMELIDAGEGLRVILEP